jgi:hypothetical protein
MPRLADLRSNLRTIDDARSCFDRLARLELDVAKADAAFEARIAALKMAHEEKTAEDRATHDALADELRAFIETHQALFADPRKVETSLGSFGLQRVTELDVQDEAAALASCQEQDLQDCWKTITKLVLTAIRKRLDAGGVIDGVAIRAGDTAVYRVAKSLLDEARQSAG